MKNIKKIAALILALAMVFALTATAFAADDTYTGSGNTNATITGTEIPLTKGIVFFNANGSTVYEPTITFTYTVAPASIAADGTDATVTDDTPLVGNVYPGPSDGVTGTTIAFSANNTAAAAADGAEIEHSGNLTFDASKFTRPGIYRYIITETCSPTLESVGMKARTNDYDATRYLDVYVRNGASGFEMYGAVIFKTTETNPGDEGKDDITTTTEKTTGFEPAKDPTDPNYSYENDNTVDKYYTYDFTVKKTVSGSLADKNWEFPFYVTVSNSISGAKFTYTADGSETFTGATESSGVVTLTAANFSIGSDAATSNLNLKHNDTITLVGLPSNQTTKLAVVIKEFNNTYDKYTPTASATNGTLTMTSGAAMTAVSGSDATGSFEIVTNDVAAQILAIDNNLTEISPTGYVVRIAPYAIMLGLGIALLMITRRRKENEEEAAAA